MKFDDFKNIIERNLDNFKDKNVMYEGEFGDPMVNPEITKFIDYGCNLFRDLNVVTNGGVRTPNFYKSLKVYSNLTLVFSIDGLGDDTNQIYRKRVDTKKALTNMITYAKAKRGKNTYWQFLVFEHNFFEIPEVLDLAKQYRIRVFIKINRRPKFMISDKRLEIAKRLYDNNCHKFSEFSWAN